MDLPLIVLLMQNKPKKSVMITTQSMVMDVHKVANNNLGLFVMLKTEAKFLFVQKNNKSTSSTYTLKKISYPIKPL